MKNSLVLKLALIVTLVSVPLVDAAPIVFEFSPSSPGGALGTSAVFTSGAYSLTAYGFTNPGNAATALYRKYTTGNPGETGLGLKADSDHEIPSSYYVQLDVQNLIESGFKTLTFTLGSLQVGELGKIYGDNTAGSIQDAWLLSTLTYSGGLLSSVTLDLTTRYFDITGAGTNGGDPVLKSVTANVPDSGSTLLLVGAALVGFPMLRRSRPGSATVRS